MFEAFGTMFTFLTVFSMIVFGITLLCQRFYPKSNWKAARLLSNAFLIFNTIVFLATDYFSNQPVKSITLDLLLLVSGIIIFICSYWA